MSGERKALIVANDKYDQQALRDLHAPAADAEALRRVLADPQIGDFAVQVIHNEAAHVTTGRIEDFFYDGRPDDLLLMHFSGHGLKSESGELFFAASNTRTDRLGSTAVAADFLQRCLRDSRSRSVVLLLDCCYSGAFTKGIRVRAAGGINVLDSFPQPRADKGRGRAVITASNAMEFAFEGSSSGDDAQPSPSMFTAALVEGLATGDADRDEDGWIALGELYDYIFDKVRAQTPHQTPSRRIELEGELYLARSRRRRIRPAPIPADLQTALADTNMYTRLGAMTELRSRLASDNLPNAVAAYEALAEVARTATRGLAEPAAEALSEVAVRPNLTEVHFGQIDQGATPPHQAIRLLGPPIARACVPRPSHDWIRIEQADDVLDVSIDTASTGRLNGGLALQGPTGKITIPIDVDLRVPASPARILLRTESTPLGPQSVVNGDHREANLGVLAGVSDRGLRHPRNEDAFQIAMVPTKDGPITFTVVSDGVSSAPHPDEASHTAVSTASTFLAESLERGDDQVEASLRAVRAAGQAVVKLADNNDGAPAATYVSAVVTQEKITVCWLGDSRAYWLAAYEPTGEGPNYTIELNGGSRRVTRDDSLAEEIVAAGLASMDEAMASPQAHVITRWLGAELPEPEPHIEDFSPTGPGVLLICSDGLWNYRPEAAELAAMVMPAALTRPLDAAAELVNFAIESGGLDNITAVVIPFPPWAPRS